MATRKAKAAKKVAKVMHEWKRGTLESGRSGQKVTSRKQAIAIGLAEAREAGADIPRKKPKKTRAKKARKKAGKNAAAKSTRR